jgi:non-specific serine/threonine protein kinase
MIGQTVSHYKVLEKLGEGGMGVVYRAEDTRLKRTVALKFLPPEFMRDPEARERFLNEARAAAALEHQNICNIYEIDETGDRVFIVMSCCKGENLKEKIFRGPLKIDEALKIAGQLAEGLQQAHEQGIIHRDIKSANIMIDEKVQVKIMDFGLAKLKGRTVITKEGTTMGTAAYMSPEQAQGVNVDHRTDLWSLGVVLYEMVTGKLPFRGDYDQAVIYSVLNEEPEPLTALRTGAPMELQRIINKALSKDPSERYQHADDLVVDLKKLEKDSKSGIHVPGKTDSKIKTSPKKTREKIVILPFENLGHPEDKYFADGMSEEITSRLAAVSGLGVISRTSAVQYDRKGKTMTQIGEDLGADYVLEGTVRWEHGRDRHRLNSQPGHRLNSQPGHRLNSQPGHRVRITPQLIRVADDTHLWSEIYDRTLESIFEVQSEIAKHVIDKLDITLLEPERQTLEERPTENIDAYNAFLRGIENLGQPDFDEKSWEMAVQMFERAVQLDPDFTAAYAMLSMTHSGIYWLGHDRTKERIAKAKAAVDRARQLKPDSPGVHLALGNFYASCHNAPQQAMEEFSIARKGFPNNADIIGNIAHFQRDQGRFHEAIDNYKSAIDLDPQNGHFNLMLGITYIYLREYAQAEQFLERSISLVPDQLLAYSIKADNYLLRKGDLEKARATLERMPRKNEADSILIWHTQEVFEKNYLAALDRLSSLPGDIINQAGTYITKSQLTGYIYQYMEKPGLARTSFDSARVLLEKEMKKQPDDARIHGSMGIVYAKLDRKEEAIREGKRALELNPVSGDALFGPERIEDLAYIYVIVGEYELAIDTLDYLLSIPSYISVPWLRLDPKWDPLREHRGFQKLLEKYSPDKEDTNETDK